MKNINGRTDRADFNGFLFQCPNFKQKKQKSVEICRIRPIRSPILSAIKPYNFTIFLIQKPLFVAILTQYTPAKAG